MARSRSRSRSKIPQAKHRSGKSQLGGSPGRSASRHRNPGVTNSQFVKSALVATLSHEIVAWKGGNRLVRTGATAGTAFIALNHYKRVNRRLARKVNAANNRTAARHAKRSHRRTRRDSKGRYAGSF